MVHWRGPARRDVLTTETGFLEMMHTRKKRESVLQTSVNELTAQTKEMMETDPPRPLHPTVRPKDGHQPPQQVPHGSDNPTPSGIRNLQCCCRRWELVLRHLLTSPSCLFHLRLPRRCLPLHHSTWSSRSSTTMMMMTTTMLDRGPPPKEEFLCRPYWAPSISQCFSLLLLSNLRPSPPSHPPPPCPHT